RNKIELIAVFGFPFRLRSLFARGYFPKEHADGSGQEVSRADGAAVGGKANGIPLSNHWRKGEAAQFVALGQIPNDQILGQHSCQLLAVRRQSQKPGWFRTGYLERACLFPILDMPQADLGDPLWRRRERGAAPEFHLGCGAWIESDDVSSIGP